MLEKFKDGINKILNLPGSFYVYVSPKFMGATFVDKYVDSVETDGATIERHISYSKDEKDWTAWEKITPGYTKEIKSKPLYFKVMWKVVANPDFSFITINNVSLNITSVNQAVKPTKPHRVSVYDRVANSFTNREKRMNLWANRFGGTEVCYYRTLPDLDSKDVILNEYSIKGVVEQKTINVVIENTPDMTPTYEEFGINIERFEVFVDFEYFREMFGPDNKPRNEDRLFIPYMEMLYRVNSAYLLNGTKERRMSWVLSLIKHTEDENMVQNGLLEQIKDITLTKDDVFAEEMLVEMTDAMNSDQTTLSDGNKLRSYMSSKISIVNNKLVVNGNTIFENHLEVDTDEEYPVIYRPLEQIKGNYSVTFLFSYSRNCILLQDNEHTIAVNNNKLVVNNVILNHTLDVDVWYGVVINLYDKNCEVNIWKQKTVYRSKIDTSLDVVTSQFLNTRFSFDRMMTGIGAYKLANLRIWKIPVSTEYQSFVLTSRTVEKASKTYLIDNFDPDIHMHNFGLDTVR